MMGIRDEIDIIIKVSEVLSFPRESEDACFPALQRKTGPFMSEPARRIYPVFSLNDSPPFLGAAAALTSVPRSNFLCERQWKQWPQSQTQRGCPLVWRADMRPDMSLGEVSSAQW
jgi:hypothetical protein